MKKMAGGLGADESDAGEDIEYSDAESEQEGGSAAGHHRLGINTPSLIVCVMRAVIQ